jgi:hypothetical protein
MMLDDIPNFLNPFHNPFLSLVGWAVPTPSIFFFSFLVVPVQCFT